jgi:hypothetical protein
MLGEGTFSMYSFVFQSVNVPSSDNKTSRAPRSIWVRSSTDDYTPERLRANLSFITLIILPATSPDLANET